MAKLVKPTSIVTADYARDHRVSHAQVVTTVRSFGLTCTWRSHEGEYRVNLPIAQGGTEDTAYYTGCPADAIATAEAMAAHHARMNPPPQLTAEQAIARIAELGAALADLKAFADMTVLKTQRFAEDLSAICQRHGLD